MKTYWMRSARYAREEDQEIPTAAGVLCCSKFVRLVDLRNHRYNPACDAAVKWANQ